ncbi:MAG: hypothetical protein JWQ90_1010 [Hydrocarboniphaga sp.]|uniref:hypothetical protein n=1 Tax=Hydrocarboniphaga sp. TaxID=2033016 RepID=UPI002601D526|nr:hypothetical protein [Hydrocarboniphaga sp.]MDB5968560.1 hypothetical protein [Hydrocarboniphaga sp.]
MWLNWRTVAVALSLLAASGCGTKGDWMGADAEKAYDKELEAKRMASVLNNDDYYQIHLEGRVYVLSDAKDFSSLIKLGEVPKTVTKIGGGPNGERLVYDVTSSESKIMEGKTGYKGSAQEMYEGTREGLAKGFFGVMFKDGRYVVTDEWAVAKQFRSGVLPEGGTPGTMPDGKPVSYLVKTDLKEVQARFIKLLQ